MIHRTTGLVGLVILLLLSWFPSLGFATDPPPKLVFLLVDLSGSAAREQARELYLKRAHEIIGGENPKDPGWLNPGDRIVIGAIQDKSAVKGVFPVNEELKTYNPWEHNKLTFMAEFLEKKKAIREQVDNLLKQPASPATEIMSALVPAQQVFASFPNYPRKILVVMSDMVEESAQYNFHKRPPGKKDVDRIIAAEKKQNRLPDLKGVKVYVVGAGGKSSEDMLKIREFWLAYFQACGADLNPANYGADLIKFE